MTQYRAKPMSRKDISAIAIKFRKILGAENTMYFPVIQIIELILPKIDKKFDLEVVEPNELPSGTYAVTYPDEHRMVIRSDVYEGVCKDQGRARFTLAHEIFHYLFHEEGNIGFARSNAKLPAYADPEWQANVFAAELLIPCHLIHKYNINEVVEQCCVSRQCAKIQMSNYKLL